MESRQKQTNIVPYRKKRRFNFIFVVFLMILIYLIVQIYRMATRESIRIFTVASPTETSALHDYRGVITRDERVVLTEQEGYVNYYVREGRKVGVGATIYTTDEGGSFSQLLAETYTNGSCLSDDMIADLKEKLTEAGQSGTADNFAEIYAHKKELAAAVADSFLYTALEELQETGDEISGVTTDTSGYIVYRTDSLDGLTPEQVREETFDEAKLKVSVYTSGDSRSAGAFAYKLIPDDRFSITFPITREDARRYQNNRYINIELISLGVTVNGSFSIFTSEDGIQMATVTLNKYGSEYLTDRYVDFRITQSSSEGYKIPVTSVTSKSFFVVPAEFIIKDKDTGACSVYKETLDGSGGSGGENISISVYEETDTQYYIYSSELEVGDYLIQEDSTNRFLLSAVSPLDGVYNVNRGYCIFRKVDIIEKTTDGNYYMVETGSRFGISTNDRIVLNADLVEENQIIN